MDSNSDYRIFVYMAAFFLLIDKSVNHEPSGFLDDLMKGYPGAFSWISPDRRSGVVAESSGPNFLTHSGRDVFSQPSYSVEGTKGWYIISNSRIDYRQELAGKLGVPWNIAKAYSHSKLILLAYLQWGEACLSHLYGDFAFAIWDHRRNEVFCARDQFGVKSLYYFDQPGFLAIASEISAFRRLPGFRYEIEEQYILDSMCSILTTEPSTAYKGISRLKPAHYFKMVRGQLSGQSRYWDLQLKTCYQDLTLEKASQELKQRFTEAVRQRIPKEGQIGFELSGGLDSSAIASTLTLLTGNNIKLNAFTHSVSPEGASRHVYQKNELESCNVLIKKYKAIKHFSITEEHSDGGYASLVEALNILYKPINQHYALNSDRLFEVAGHQSTSIIFSGLGGDEGVSYQGTGIFNELISTGQHAALRKNLKSAVHRHGIHFYKRLIRIYISYYAPWPLHLLRKDWRKATYRSFAIQKRLARKNRMKRRFFRGPSLPDRPDVRNMQYSRIMFPNIPGRIEETALLAKQYGIEYRYPFLDVKLLELFYSLPSEYKVKNGMGRYLFRLSMKGILPEKIRMRTDKSGYTIPGVFSRILKDEQIFREIIEEGRLKNRFHYADYNKLHKMLDSFKKMDEFKRPDYDLRAFQSAMSVLILQKWQRTGQIDIGIKC